MKRASRFLVGISLLLTGLFGLPLGALAMNSSVSNSGSSCDDGYPAAYTGGAGVAKSFHESDGSTITITNTGAVIKQSPCHTAYREGWVNVSDICNIDSGQDLSGHLSSGTSNPGGSATFAGCSTAQTSGVTQRPTESASQTQSQSQSVTVNVPPQVEAATTTVPSRATSTVKTLPNTGPGNVIALAGMTTALGTAGHWFYNRRSRRFK